MLSPKSVWTIRDIANETDAETWQIEHVVRRDRIEPERMAGHCRLFDAEAAKRIKTSLATTRRRGR